MAADWAIVEEYEEGVVIDRYETEQEALDVLEHRGPDGDPLMVPFPMPNDKILGGTVIASTWYSDDYEAPLILVLLLMPEAPFYTVGNVWLRPGCYEWEGFQETHETIVPAINGVLHPGTLSYQSYGYTQMGGDY